MGGSRGRRQEASENRSREATDYEQARAEEFRRNLDTRRASYGHLDPDTVHRTLSGNAQQLAGTGGVVPMDIDTSGRGYEGYQDFAKTGGFTPEESTAFLRRSTAPTAAIYGAARDDLSRRSALQGGYSPGFSASDARLTRQAANAGAEASLSGNLELNRQIREGKLAGLSGMERVKAQAEEERLAKQAMTQQGLFQGQEALQKVAQYGTASLNDLDIMDLRNRLQRGQMTQFDAELLQKLASMDKTLFDKVMQGISTVGGAVAGVMGAIPSGGSSAAAQGG